MSQADELLESLASGLREGEVGNIVIGDDCFITVPESLKRIAVQYDHDVETVTFDCPRYKEVYDMSTMKIYINYVRSDGVMGTHLCDNVIIDSADNDIMHFDWTVSGHVTYVAGPLSFLVCIQKTDSEGNELFHWNSEVNNELYVSPGMKCQDVILTKHPDIITQLLERMDQSEAIVAAAETAADSAKSSAKAAEDAAATASVHTNNTDNPHSVTAEQVGAVKKSGDTMNGNLNINKASQPAVALNNTTNGRASWYHASESDSSVVIQNRLDENNRATFVIQPETKALTSALQMYRVVGGKGTLYDILHTGNIDQYISGSASNPNLLDNWYFADPIDQRGGYVVPPGTKYYTARDWVDTYLAGMTTVYVPVVPDTYSDVGVVTINSVKYYVYWGDAVRGYVGAGYGIDRWRLNNGSLNIDGGIAFSANDVLYQPSEYPLNDGQTRTFSYLDVNGLLFSCVLSGAYTAVGSYLVTHNNTSTLYFRSTSNAPKIVAVKLELGSEQTLAHQDENGTWVLNDPPPDKGMELLKCCMSTADSADTYANNKVTPAAINAVNKNGDTMTGGLNIAIPNKTKLSLIPEASGVRVEAYTADWNKRKFLWMPAENATAPYDKLQYVEMDTTNGKNGRFDILHTGNKPSGSYTGNGDATSRTIEIGGITGNGAVLKINSTNNTLGFVYYNGAMVFHLGESKVYYFTSSQMNFKNGVLTIASNSHAINYSGSTYYYQVL